jgi:hypothetical protein
MGGRVKASIAGDAAVHPKWAHAALGKCGGADNKVHSLGTETASGLARFPDLIGPLP